jgi:hypothetical protein
MRASGPCTTGLRTLRRHAGPSPDATRRLAPGALATALVLLLGGCGAPRDPFAGRMSDGGVVPG